MRICILLACLLAGCASDARPSKVLRGTDSFCLQDCLGTGGTQEFCTDRCSY
jgi:hypothetical protein